MIVSTPLKIQLSTEGNFSVDSCAQGVDNLFHVVNMSKYMELSGFLQKCTLHIHKVIVKLCTCYQQIVDNIFNIHNL